MTWVDMVKAFHLKYGAPVAERPGLIDESRAQLRASLIREEAAETTDSIEYPTDSLALEDIADGLADTIYVCIGAALEYGIDIDRVFAEVHRSNMTKTVGHARSDGKIMKGPDFEPPRIREIIEEDMER